MSNHAVLSETALAALIVIASSQTGPSSRASIYRALDDDDTGAIDAVINQLVADGFIHVARSLTIGDSVIEQFATTSAGQQYLQEHPQPQND